VSQTEIGLPTPPEAEPSEARQNQAELAQDLAEYKFGWSDGSDDYAFTSERGLTRDGSRPSATARTSPPG
jgi:hypothetical protein